MNIKNRLAILIAILCIGCHAKFDKTEESANSIIDALDKFKSDIGEYPERLIDLTPRYLDSIPNSAYDQRDFIYTKVDGQFELIYLGALGVEAKYNSSKKAWTYDD